MLCLRALFWPTNELFNSWSALLPALFYLWQLRNSAEILGGADPRPFYRLLLSAALNSLASFLAHGFSAVSPLAAQIFYCLDYAGIALLGLGIVLAEHAYGGAGDGGEDGAVLDGAVLPVAALLAVLGCAVACWSRLNRCQRRGQLLRLGGLAALYLWSAAAGRWSTLRGAATLSVVAAAAVYASLWPERRWPGRWDVLGHSHGTFHVLVQVAIGCCVADVRRQLEAALSGRAPRGVRWWTEVGYGRVVVALVATAVGFTALYAATEGRDNEAETEVGRVSQAVGREDSTCNHQLSATHT